MKNKDIKPLETEEVVKAIEPVKEEKVKPATSTDSNEHKVYCGPSVKGVARQYTVYSGGLPEAVKAFMEAHPLAKQLIVPVNRLADMRLKLETKGSKEMLIYQKLRSEL